MIVLYLWCVDCLCAIHWFDDYCRLLSRALSRELLKCAPLWINIEKYTRHFNQLEGLNTVMVFVGERSWHLIRAAIACLCAQISSTIFNRDLTKCFVWLICNHDRLLSLEMLLRKEDFLSNAWRIFGVLFVKYLKQGTAPYLVHHFTTWLLVS